MRRPPVTEPAPATEPYGALLAPVPMRTAGERIAERLVTAIALGEFEPGQRLPTERDLSATLEVSRTTGREALHRLQAACHLTTRLRRGCCHLLRHRPGPGSRQSV